ncbi:MAG: AmmeMemoRadiSam system protein B [Syntrophobacteraceae bacterium]
MSGKFRKISLFLAVFSVLLASRAFLPGTSMPLWAAPAGVHEPVIAGTWYPGDPAELKAQVETFLDRAPKTGVDGEITALISPHAGLVYSGQVAAYSYTLLRERKFDTVVVIAPSHHVAFRGAAVLDCSGFRTPLGVMPVDSRMVSDLMKREPRIKDFPEAFRKEHSLEIQLPFLQAAMPGAKLVPLIMGEHDLATCRYLADALAACIKDRSVLIVASSDLSHFHGYDAAREMDNRLLDKVRALNAEELDECLRASKCEACGRGPILTAMIAARKLGANNCKVLQYANSGDVTGDKTSPRGVVGYAAAVIFKAPADKDEAGPARKRKAGIDLGLTDREKAELHSIARKTIEARCRGASLPEIETTSAKLKETCAAFVTLYKKGELRGCIGHVIAQKPLARTVAEMAEAAALHDPRFSPVRPDELADIKIEISVMTPLQKIDSPDEIVVGKHGLVIRRGMSTGLLLPQVATEHGWDRTAFLEYTCRKAGLPGNAWKDKETEIYVFSADVF